MGRKLATRTAVKKYFNDEQKNTNDSVTNSWFQRETKKKGLIISVLNFFFPRFLLWLSISNNLLIMDSFIGIMKDFASRLFTMSPFYTAWSYPSNLWFSDVFREYKRGTLGRNKSRFLTHSSSVFLFCNPVNVTRP